MNKKAFLSILIPLLLSFNGAYAFPQNLNLEKLNAINNSRITNQKQTKPVAVISFCGTTDKTSDYFNLTSGPTANLCRIGSKNSKPVFDGSKWTWTCSFGSKKTECSANQKINGSCGTANNSTYSYEENSWGAFTQCASGSPSSSAFPSQGNSASWTCSGTNGGASSGTCIAYRKPVPVNGQCGSSNGGTFSSIPASGLCSVGTAGSVSGNGSWSWTCSGVNGGTPASCSANKTQPTINGQCGSSNNGTFSSVPATNLCHIGTASAVSGSGPWNWTCSGENNGVSASCSALKEETIPEESADYVIKIKPFLYEDVSEDKFLEMISNAEKYFEGKGISINLDILSFSVFSSTDEESLRSLGALNGFDLAIFVGPFGSSSYAWTNSGKYAYIKYNNGPDWHSWSSNSQVLAHEMGHYLGYHDLYSYPSEMPRPQWFSEDLMTTAEGFPSINEDENKLFVFNLEQIKKSGVCGMYGWFNCNRLIENPFLLNLSIDTLDKNSCQVYKIISFKDGIETAPSSEVLVQNDNAVFTADAYNNLGLKLVCDADTYWIPFRPLAVSAFIDNGYQTISDIDLECFNKNGWCEVKD
jgi:hypothetical protein